MNKKISIARNTAYNTAGSCFYLACQWLLTVLVIRLGSVEDGGILTLAMSVTNVLFTLCTFGIRSFQVSDYQHEYTTGEYVTTRVFLCCCGILAAAAYCGLFAGYSGYEAACVMAYMMFRVGEALSDVHQAIQQVQERMDYIFRSFVLRGVLLVGTFAGAMAATHDLLTAFCLLTAATGAVVLLYELPVCRKLDRFSWKFSLKRTGKLIAGNIPLMTNSLLMAFCVTIPRSALDAIEGHYVMGIYGSIAAPAAIVQSAVLWLYMPSMTQFAKYYHEKQKDEFAKLNRRMIALTGGAASAVLAGAAVLGRWGLGLLFGEEVAAHAALLLPTLAATVMIAAEYYVSALLTVARNLKAIFISNAAAVAITLVVADPLIRAYGAQGVNDTLYCSMGVTLVIQVAAAVRAIRRQFKECTMHNEEQFTKRSI